MLVNLNPCAKQENIAVRKQQRTNSTERRIHNNQPDDEDDNKENDNANDKDEDKVEDEDDDGDDDEDEDNEDDGLQQQWGGTVWRENNTATNHMMKMTRMMMMKMTG